jgi:hypothetical protein
MLEHNYGIKCSKLYVVGFGLDKQEEQEPGPFEHVLPSLRKKRILDNVDLHEMDVDLDFQAAFVRSRLKYLSYFRGSDSLKRDRGDEGVASADTEHPPKKTKKETIV